MKVTFMTSMQIMLHLRVYAAALLLTAAKQSFPRCHQVAQWLIAKRSWHVHQPPLAA